MKFHLPFIVGGLLAMSSSAFAMSLNYQEVGYNIEARGARAVVAELEKSGQLPAVENNIKLGDDNWIAMAPKLASAGNPKFTEGVKSALSSALIYNPAAVLKAVSGSKILTLSDVCTAPIDVKDSEAKANFQQRASRTLLTIKNSDMAGPRDSCLAELKKLS
ncbi:hypothetical protein CQP30_16055 [Yersinia pestis]|uniref:Uncharacterized protein n=3 Tax=Yersinia pestis TaxID=632 RepID=A0A5P8YL86_YERPE|nr:hypothetical protein [Yersinia pestis]EFA47810.1 conserved hypothetical protein [Yersinia pestis KIM D27]ERP79986.1 hypothetical protein L327_17705 [Yersinia pestis S3]AAM83724.1 hypothetical [Yersinia pestis KIM10+]AAS63960.1 hypothetical protein YP_3813 [Yersinia pestis biovar Microtus str. 91001]ABG19768.1 hypothetical protein YPN_3441 [Yersinia pestis Nepal516]